MYSVQSSNVQFHVLIQDFIFIPKMGIHVESEFQFNMLAVTGLI
jgi:hypothetical protein